MDAALRGQYAHDEDGQRSAREEDRRRGTRGAPGDCNQRKTILANPSLCLQVPQVGVCAGKERHQRPQQDQG